jgi:hypothetical protein
MFLSNGSTKLSPSYAIDTITSSFTFYFTQNIEQTRNEYDKIKGKMRKIYHDLLDGRITQDMHDEIANELEARQQELNDRLKLLTSDNKSFQVTASYLLDLAQRSAELFKTYILNDPFKTIVETKKKALSGSNSDFGAGWGTQTPGLFLGKEALYQLS